MIAIYILLMIIGAFVVVFLDALFSSLISISLAFLVFLLLCTRNVNLKILVPSFAFLSLILDVVNHYRLGTYLLVSICAVSFLLLFSFVFSAREGLLSYLLKFITFIIYYLLINIVPNFFLTGSFGWFDINLFWSCIVSSLFSIAILILIDILLSRFRKRGFSSQFQLK